ncbi:hypothetical protein [Variovorax sp. CY25R-8]|nr:hypothetical protein [Variovorax sp. CY25R-8]MCT8176363.1 hypothetical protein [Variovorax sp. CY25R-8]
MANSLFIPISQPPADVLEVESLVAEVFLELGKAPPRLSLRRNDDVPATNLMTSFLMFEGEGPNDFCWTSISELPIEITEDSSRPYMVNVTTRGDWKFGGAVAYAFCKHEGSCVFNDSGVLDGSPRFDADSLRNALLADP